MGIAVQKRVCTEGKWLERKKKKNQKTTKKRAGMALATEGSMRERKGPALRETLKGKSPGGDRKKTMKEKTKKKKSRGGREAHGTRAHTKTSQKRKRVSTGRKQKSGGGSNHRGGFRKKSSWRGEIQREKEIDSKRKRRRGRKQEWENYKGP